MGVHGLVRVQVDLEKGALEVSRCKTAPGHSEKSLQIAYPAVIQRRSENAKRNHAANYSGGALMKQHYALTLFYGLSTLVGEHGER